MLKYQKSLAHKTGAREKSLLIAYVRKKTLFNKSFYKVIIKILQM